MSFKDLYGDADTSELGTGELKPFVAGRYVGQVVNAAVNLSGPGDPRVDWEFKVVSDGDYKNRKLWKTSMLNAKGMKYFKKDMESLLVTDQFDDFDQLAGSLKGFLNKKLELYVKSVDKDDAEAGKYAYWDRTYINGLYNAALDANAETKTAPPASDTGEEIPF